MTPFPRSIRSRLTLWYVAILAAVLVLFSIGVYVSLARALSDNLNDSLRTRATIVEGSIEYDAAGRPSLDLPTDARDPNLGDSFERVFDPAGQIIFDNSQVFGAVPAAPADLARALQSGDLIVTRGSGENEARTLTRPLSQGGQLVGIVQVGQSTSDLNDTLTNLLLILGLGGPVALVLASFGGWWLSSRALAPIDHVTKLAQEITGHDLSRRLNLSLPDDEVGRLARTFDDMIARLDGMFERQRQFTADASHELRTPLTAMKGQIDVALQLLREPAAYQGVLAAVNEQVDRMTRLVGELLMLARSDAGAIELVREQGAVEDLVDAVAEFVRPAAQSKGLDIVIDAGPPVDLVADQDLVLQLLLNLTDNAVKYTDAGAVTIGWRVPANDVEIFVRDTGRGIPAEHRTRIFERFHRVRSNQTDDVSGSGLGLAICKWIVEAHGGNIRVEGNDTGSTFTATLPRT